LTLFNYVLPSLPLPSPGSEELKPFLIELYNLAVKVSFEVNGVPSTTVDRLGYFDSCKVRVNIGGTMER